MPHTEGHTGVPGDTDDRPTVHLEGEVARQLEELVAWRPDEGFKVDDLQLHEGHRRAAPRHIQFDPARDTRAVGHGDVLRHHVPGVVKVDGDPIDADPTHGFRHLDVNARLLGRLAGLAGRGGVEGDPTRLLH